jgi:hypothetical protein
MHGTKGKTSSENVTGERTETPVPSGKYHDASSRNLDLRDSGHSQTVGCELSVNMSNKIPHETSGYS